MIATSGDEAFVMFSMFPESAILINIILFFLAIVVAFIVDMLFADKKYFMPNLGHEFEVHKEEHCHCFSKHTIGKQLKHMIFPRAFLITLFGVLLLAIFFSQLGP